MHENKLGNEILGAAIHIHRQLGPGLFESVYEAVLSYELKRLGHSVQRQEPISINYRDLRIPEAFKADMIVNEMIILELKSVEKIEKIHCKQLLTYLKLSGIKLGYLINFGSLILKDGVTRLVNGL